jgi:hypothetical protein
MKKYLIYSYLFLATTLMNNCKEDSVVLYPVDNTPPQQISNVVVNNIPGGAKLTYQLPDQEDLLYVQALYNLPNGNSMITKTSVFSNTMLVKGFGKSQKSTIQLVSFDRSMNQSKPLSVDIKPLDSPIYGILDSLKVQESFGGFKLTWQNPYKEDVVLGVLLKNRTTGAFSYIDNFYSSEALSKKSIRGMDSTSATIGLFVRDTYENYTDTLVMNVKPLFEQEVPKSGFVAMTLSKKFSVEPYGGALPSKMWDGITNVDNNLYYLKINTAVQTGLPIILPIFTFNMGLKVKLSRFRLWQRVDYLFVLHNPKLFEWYGTNDAVVAADAETTGWETNPKWIKIMSGESRRPSSLATGSALTTEDVAYARAGEEFEFPLDAPAVRYLRFKLLSTWSGSTSLHINELTFWGQIEK